MLVLDACLWSCSTSVVSAASASPFSACRRWRMSAALQRPLHHRQLSCPQRLQHRRCLHDHLRCTAQHCDDHRVCPVQCWLFAEPPSFRSDHLAPCDNLHHLGCCVQPSTASAACTAAEPGRRRILSSALAAAAALCASTPRSAEVLPRLSHPVRRSLRRFGYIAVASSSRLHCGHGKGGRFTGCLHPRRALYAPLPSLHGAFAWVQHPAHPNGASTTSL